MGNKGGVGIRLDFFESSMCFINSHLDADKDKVDGRNADMKDITERMLFRPPEVWVITHPRVLPLASAKQSIISNILEYLCRRVPMNLVPA